MPTLAGNGALGRMTVDGPSRVTRPYHPSCTLGSYAPFFSDDSGTTARIRRRPRSRSRVACQNMQPRRARSLSSSFWNLIRWPCPYTVGTCWLAGFKTFRESLIREVPLLGSSVCLCQHKGHGVILVRQMFPVEGADLPGVPLQPENHISPGRGNSQRIDTQHVSKKQLVSRGTKEKLIRYRKRPGNGSRHLRSGMSICHAASIHANTGLIVRTGKRHQAGRLPQQYRRRE